MGAALCREAPARGERSEHETQRLRQALDNLRKQHIWGDIADEEYRQDRAALERQLKLLERPAQPRELSNLERASQLLEDLRELWLHPGVTDEQREGLLREVFERITIDGKVLTAIEPKPAYQPLFATIITAPEFGYCPQVSPVSTIRQ